MEAQCGLAAKEVVVMQPESRVTAMVSIVVGLLVEAPRGETCVVCCEGLVVLLCVVVFD